MMETYRRTDSGGDQPVTRARHTLSILKKQNGKAERCNNLVANC